MTNLRRVAESQEQRHMPEEVKNKILKEFKSIAGNDLVLDKQEYENIFIKEYVNNRYNIKGGHSPGDTLGSILANIGEDFDKANTNGKYGLNIDEYTDMVYERKMGENFASQPIPDAKPAPEYKEYPDKGEPNYVTPVEGSEIQEEKTGSAPKTDEGSEIIFIDGKPSSVPKLY